MDLVLIDPKTVELGDTVYVEGYRGFSPSEPLEVTYLYNRAHEKDYGFKARTETGIERTLPDGDLMSGRIKVYKEVSEAVETPSPTKAPDFLEKGAALMRERGEQYDKPDGERSMGVTIKAFNTITGRDLTESEGWLLLQLLKDVRQWQNPDKYHADSAEDCIAYAALKAEALSQGL